MPNRGAGPACVWSHHLGLPATPVLCLQRVFLTTGWGQDGGGRHRPLSADYREKELATWLRAAASNGRESQHLSEQGGRRFSPAHSNTLPLAPGGWERDRRWVRQLLPAEASKNVPEEDRPSTAEFKQTSWSPGSGGRFSMQITCRQAIFSYSSAHSLSYSSESPGD